MSKNNGQNLFNFLVVILATVSIVALFYVRLLSPEILSSDHQVSSEPLAVIDQDKIDTVLSATVSVQGRAYQGDTLVSSSSGSGFFIDNEGHILTNEHVINGCDLIYVIDRQGNSVRAQIVSYDTRMDIALLKIDPEYAGTYLAFGDTDNLQHGQTIIASGNPLNTGSDGKAVLTFGRISRLYEKTSASSDFDNDRFYSNLIQFDASIYPGNSGGPLVDENARVIGIITAVSNTSAKRTMGYAICLDSRIRDIIQILAKGQTIQHGFLGTNLASEIPFSVINKYNLTNLTGAYVTNILPGSPAAQAGVLPGDIITAISGEIVRGKADLLDHVNSTEPGTLVEIELLRSIDSDKLSKHNVQAKLENRTVANRNGYYQELELPSSSGWGLVVKPVTNWRRDRTGLPDNQSGLLVYEVDPNSLAYRQGIKPGDIITKIDQQPVRTLAEFELITKKSVFSPDFQTWNIQSLE